MGSLEIAKHCLEGWPKKGLEVGLLEGYFNCNIAGSLAGRWVCWGEVLAMISDQPEHIGI